MVLYELLNYRNARLSIDLTPGWIVILGFRVARKTRECDLLFEPRIIGQLKSRECNQ